MTLTPEDERAIKEYDDFAESRIAAGDTPSMIGDSTWAALPHVATAEQLRGNRIPVRDFREPEFEEFVRRRLAAGDRPQLILDSVRLAARDALDKAKSSGMTLTKKQREAVLFAEKQRAAEAGR